MKKLEIVGNITDTMCRVVGERLTLGAAKKFADEMMLAELEKSEKDRKYYSFEIDNGSGRSLYTSRADTVSTPLLKRNVQYA